MMFRPLVRVSVISASLLSPCQSHDYATDSSRAADAVHAMMEFYDVETGRWNPDSPWWQSGNALQALLDYMDKTNTREYIPVAENTIRIQRAPLSWWPEGEGEFRASSTDDTGWWALAMTTMFDLTQNDTYLEIAELGEEYMHNYWDDVCGGGIYWRIKGGLAYKNAISIQLFIKLAAALHNRIPGDLVYLEHALMAYNWFNESGMINSEGLVNDGLNDDCENNAQTTWSYNQGVILGGLVELYHATGDDSFLGAAKSIADAVLFNLGSHQGISVSLSPNGILAEGCENVGQYCNVDQASFKGIFVRNLGELDEILDDRPYRDYLLAQASSAYDHGRNESDFYSLSWSGPFSSSAVGISTQDAAVSLLVAVLERNKTLTGSTPPTPMLTDQPTDQPTSYPTTTPTIETAPMTEPPSLATIANPAPTMAPTSSVVSDQPEVTIGSLSNNEVATSGYSAVSIDRFALLVAIGITASFGLH